MLNTNSGQQRHRQHRRQISTPTAHEAAKVPNIPAPAMQRYQAHRRGQSLDQRSVQAQRPITIQDGTFPTTNATVQQPQNFLRDAQQHQFVQEGNAPFAQNSASMPMVLNQSFNQNQLQALAALNGNGNGHGVTYIGPDFVVLGTKGLQAQQLSMALQNIQRQHVPVSSPSCESIPDRQLSNNGLWDSNQQCNFAVFPDHTNGIPRDDMRRPSVQSETSTHSQPPQTPVRQQNTRKFGNIGSGVSNADGQAECPPITPATTPFNRSASTVANEGAQSSPTQSNSLSVPGAIDGSYMQRAKSLQGVVGTTFAQPKIEMPSPPNTASFDFDNNDVFDCKQGSSFDDPESHPMSHHNYTSSSSSASSFYSTAELADMPSPEDSSGKAPKVPILPATPRRSQKKASSATPGTTPTKAKLPPREASIDNLNLDSRVHASINKTGVTMDEIASYIFGPDPEDGKYVCLHPDCQRRFGRKENIKSHVQTHLGDRQFKCEDCGKCFVRGHDLKRHAKIHTGDKPYECLCGNGFARHDALTRHRQRGMCIGGYQGVVRKTVKRGRPKKQRPEMEERQTKASKTRQRAAEKAAAQSIPGSSSISRTSPPPEILETMGLRGHSPGAVFSTPNYSLPPDAFTVTPPTSPGSSANKDSPSQAYRSLTPSTEDEMLPVLPSKRALGRIEEESDVPFISEYTDVTTSSTANPLSSPHTAPTLTDSSAGSDLDIFINQDASASLESDMASFPSYVPTSFDDGMDFFPGKDFHPVLTDEIMQYPNDELPSEVMSKDFLMD
ncbi:Transcription factor [Aspergillus sclerotialis]|uniref:Transcription factor n=1 Tax=Aspergillus sclerotialis TaxID=2070753 RepID=A0A3A2Z9C3_9EURO|nr:Transcription factor [Aspergillus sclerotialis]